MRIGAIFALERLSQDSERDHIQIMEILCAYIRMNAGRKDVALPEGESAPEDWRTWAKIRLEYPQPDVDVALKVIEQRDAKRKQHEKDKGYRLGLERAPLRKIILPQRDLTEANLGFAELQGADLKYAQLQGADLRSVDLTEVAQIEPHLEVMFGDGSVILPGGHGPEQESWPAHWPTFVFDHEQFDQEWKKWQADPEGYVPPELPEKDEQPD